MASTSHADAAPLADLTKFQRDLLAVIHAGDDPVHGLGIKAALDDAYGEEINHGRMYPNLDTLADMGLVEKGRLDKRTNSYELTRRGERELRTHLSWLNEHAGDLL